jgi:hypothetical protein
MAHHQFGSIAGDEQTGGTFNMGDAVLVLAHITAAVQSISDDEQLPVIALELSGRVNKSHDTFQAVFVMSPLDSGQIAAALANAVKRLGTEEAWTDFRAGWGSE